MFGLFSKKKYQPTVTPEDKEWIERSIIWFIEVFGFQQLNARPFITPGTTNFPYKNLKDPEQFQQLFEQMCNYWGLKPNEIIVKFFDDIKSKQWTTAWMPIGPANEPGGTYTQIYTTEEKRFRIQLAKSNLENPELLIAVMAHELAHVKLLGGKYISANDPNMEPLTDLVSIFFGFGVFVANSVQTTDGYWISRSGYLPNQLISYANALICYITGGNADNYESILNANTRDLFRKDFEFLSKTNNTTLTKTIVEATERVFETGRKITDGFDRRDFHDVIETSKKLVESNPKDVWAFNTIGYALLQQKKYPEAIEQFTTAIAISPYWDYPYNNRGYCRLQLGDLDNAFVDLDHSFEMNPDNSYSWRNLGAYYLATSEFEKALYHFQEAEKRDPKTELINFYLGQANLKLGNLEEGQKYIYKSRALKEHNDSVIE
ncbi:tetratricopeptide repeat protein [Terrimonas sp. NA20]|uniref:Tetratricopeptide repeat protein n=1 Tax=Terrimonas ginsenosidimutans TaxID=2908004 RepID=A0ABS9KPS6_9BACT|nr:tetratricopeptide repeat protein [Terrimonas ginsenosidimutans]MCG2614328.1 tetratricopeptide repeat protein [Terrimonas ginsenosidimutans]